MAIAFQPTNRAKIVLVAYVVLIWFVLVLGGSLLGTFAKSPLVFYLAVGGPVILGVSGYLLSEPFRRFARSLVGDPWGITALQTYRVLGVSMAIQALRNALPAVFGLPAGFGDFFIGVTALLAALAWSSGSRLGKVVFVLWNALGLLDLLIAVSTGVLAAVTSSGPVTMAPMRLYPFSLVPAFGVPLAFILHFTGLAQFWYLSRKQTVEGAKSMVSHLQQREPGGEASVPQTHGFVLNWARRYDLLVGFITLGRERAFRRKIADLARIQPGETVLDVGCGTGTLAIVARQRVGAAGSVSGIDPSAQMIARASHKGARRGLAIDFQVGVIEQLSFPDQSFDVVLSTFMMHHLPDDLKRQGLWEIARVLKPGGRLLVLDMKGPSGPWKSSIQDQPALMKEAGFSQVELGEMKFSGFPGLGFALAGIKEEKPEEIKRSVS